MTERHEISGTGIDEPAGGIAVVDEGGMRVIRLHGEIDSFVVAAYEESPIGVLDDVRPADVIDASDVTFLDGRGLRFLVRRTRAAQNAGGRPVLRRPAHVVERLVDVAGAGHLFTITL